MATATGSLANHRVHHAAATNRLGGEQQSSATGDVHATDDDGKIAFDTNGNNSAIVMGATASTHPATTDHAEMPRAVSPSIVDQRCAQQPSALESARLLVGADSGSPSPCPLLKHASHHLEYMSAQSVQSSHPSSLESLVVRRRHRTHRRSQQPQNVAQQRQSRASRSLSTSDHSGVKRRPVLPISTSLERQRAGGSTSDGEQAARRRASNGASDDDDEEDEEDGGKEEGDMSSDDMLGSSTSASVDSFEIAELTLDADKYMTESMILERRSNNNNASTPVTVVDEAPAAAVVYTKLEPLIEADDEGCAHASGTLSSTTNTADSQSNSVSPSVTATAMNHLTSDTGGDSGRVSAPFPRPRPRRPTRLHCTANRRIGSRRPPPHRPQSATRCAR